MAAKRGIPSVIVMVNTDEFYLALL